MLGKKLRQILIMVICTSMVLGSACAMAFAEDNLAIGESVAEDELIDNTADTDIVADDYEAQEEPLEEAALEETEAPEPFDVVVVKTPEQYASKVGNVEVGQTEPIIVDVTDGSAVSEFGEETSIKEALDITSSEAKELTNGSASENKKEITEFLDEKGVYDVESISKSEIEVSFPFAYKQIIVCAKEGALEDAHHAASVVYNRMLNQYVLEYETEELAKEAFDALANEFGASKVIVSVPVFAEYNQSKTKYTAAESVSWGNDYMHLDELRDIANSRAANSMRAASAGDSIKVAILDTGINKSKSSFAGRTITDDSTTYITDSASPYPYFDNTKETSTAYGHGTHVAGIIADGTSKQVDLMIVKVLDENGGGSLGNVFNGVRYAADHGADVINLSLGTNLYSGNEAAASAMDSYLKYAADKGVIILAAAGNESVCTDVALTYPASSQYVYAVSSLKYTNGDVAFDSSYSNYGSCIDYAAPGTSISAAYVGDNYEYQTMSGTSMATPHISAAFAMVEVFNPNADKAEVTAIIDRNVKDYGAAGIDDKYGKGAVVLTDVGASTQPEEPIAPIDTPDPDDNGGNNGGNNGGATENPGTPGGDNGNSGDNGGNGGTQPPADDPIKEPEKEPEPDPHYVFVPVITLSATSYTYNGKVQKPSVSKVTDPEGNKVDSSNYTVEFQSDSKSVGRYSVTVTLKGDYKGKNTATYDINPRGAAIKSPAKGKHYVTARWGKQATKMASSRITGYEVQITRDKTFKTGVDSYKVSGYATTSKKMTGRSRRNYYYVRVRTYMTVNGVTLYSPWSGVKTVKTK